MNEENKNINKSTQEGNNQPNQITQQSPQPQTNQAPTSTFPQTQQQISNHAAQQQPTQNINQPVQSKQASVSQEPLQNINNNQPNQTTKQQVVPTNEQQPNSQPSLLKEQDESATIQAEKTAEESNKSLILVGGFFVLMFTFIMFLPTINSYITKLKEKQLENQITDPVDEDDKNKNDGQTIPGDTNGKEVTVLCTSEESTMTDLSSMHITYTYTHIDDKIKKVEKNVIYVYQTATSENFIEQEKKCDSEIKANNDKAGYNAECKLDENTITITEIFDLTTFKTFTGTNGTTISPVTELDSSLKAEIEELTNQGYKCE